MKTTRYEKVDFHPYPNADGKDVEYGYEDVGKYSFGYKNKTLLKRAVEADKLWRSANE